MTTVRARVREQPIPGEAEAAARSWPVVEAALAEHLSGEPGAAPAPRRVPFGRRRPVLRFALVLALIAAGLLAALTPAGADVGDWIGDRFATDEEPSVPAFAPLPKGGSVLAISRSGAYAVSADGNTQHLGFFTDAGWSPRGKHVVGVDGRRLIAVTPTGMVKWTLAEPHRVSHPAWSTDEGFAVAYLERSSLRVVAGDGDPVTNRRVRGRAAAVRPAWLPHSDRVLTYATRDGTIATIDVSTGRMLWRAPVSAEALAWSRDGRRLVALSSRSLTVLDESGRIRGTIALPGVARELALHPSGRKAAVRVGRGGETRVLQVPLDGAGEHAHRAARRELFQGDVDGIAWSQNGRRLLVGWRGAGQWLLLGPGNRIRPLHDVSRELGSTGGFPRVAGWCCAG
jgi:hypothetical protein